MESKAPKNPMKLMAHLVAGYPNLDTTQAAAKGLIEAGANYLEIQFPFSDPTADGPTIEKACTLALANGFKKEQGFSLIEELTRNYPQIDVFIMCYANTAYSSGIKKFLEKTKASGARGVIIPDLPPDYDEGLYPLAKELGLIAVPVVAPSTTQKRLQMIAQLKPKIVYCAIRSGITGTHSEIDNKVKEFLANVKNLFGESEIAAGFGLKSHEQIKQMQGLCQTAIAGSYFVKAIDKAIQITSSDPDNKENRVTKRLKEAAISLRQGK